MPREIAAYNSTLINAENDEGPMRESGGEAPSRRRHSGSGTGAPSAGRFLRFYNKINAFWAYLGLYFCFKTYFDSRWKDKV